MKKRFWTPRMKTILIVAVLVFVLAAAILGLSGGTSPLENAVGVVLSPFRSGLSAIDRQAEHLYSYLFSYESMQAENAALEKQILDLESSVREAEELARENERLKALLELSDEHEDYKFLSAYITSWDSASYKSAFTIGKGTASGITEGMCAVTENGQVIGLVTKVGANWATVTTILDSSLQISASISSSGYTGVVSGTVLADGSSALRMNYLPTEAIVKNGDQVVTTGSDLYPKSLLLGHVSGSTVDETGVGKYADLTPSCDFDSLEQIFILTDYENS